MMYQYTKQVVFSSSGLVDFAVRLVVAFTGNKQLKFLAQISAEEFQEMKFLRPCENNFRLVKHCYILPRGQVQKLVLFPPAYTPT